MVRYRPLKKYGNTWVITLTTVDVKDLKLKEGDEIDIEEITILKNKRRTK